MAKSITERKAAIIRKVFNESDLNHSDIEYLADQVWNETHISVLAKIVYFCERIVNHGD